MNLRLFRLAVFAAALLVVIAILAACGKRGDPVPPGASSEPVPAPDSAPEIEQQGLF